MMQRQAARQPLSHSLAPIILWSLVAGWTLEMAEAFQSEATPVASPWWEARKLDWQTVDPDYSWDKRRTGVAPAWTAGLGEWSHYRAADLDAGSNPQPWTRGRMCKFLRKVDEASFELHSVYEKHAKGLWLADVIKERPDGYFDHNFTFVKTPYRAMKMPPFFSLLPPDLAAIEAAQTSQATIVKPDSATFAGIRFLPTVEQGRALLQRKDAYRRSQFAELWLAETVDGRPEGRKIGLFCQYDGCTGDLVQMFRMREAALPGTLSPRSPLATFDLAQIEASLVDCQYKAWTHDTHLQTPACSALLQGKPLPCVIRKGGWRNIESRVVTTVHGVVGEEVASETSLQGVEPEAIVSYPDVGQFWDCRFDDGVYARIPKSFHPDFIDDHARVTMELGSITQSGQFHRLLAVGSRREGGFKTLVYEQWQ
jgi:hypothetical protein